MSIYVQRAHFWMVGLLVLSLLSMASAVMAAPSATPHLPKQQALLHSTVGRLIQDATNGVNTRATVTAPLTMFNPEAWTMLSTGAAGGEFFFGAYEGDPFTDVDNYYSVVAASAAFLYASGTAMEYPVTAGAGTMTRVPYFDQKTQTGGFVWTTGDPIDNYTVEFKLKLVRDALSYEYDITNNTGQFRRVGFRVAMEDFFLGKPGVNYYLPDRGMMDTVQELIGSQVPNEWYVRYGTPLIPPDYRPPLLFKQVFTGANTIPERLVFGSAFGGLNDVVTYGWPDIIAAQLPINIGQQPMINSGAALDPTSFGHEAIYPLVSIASGQTRVIRGKVMLNWCAEESLGQFALGLRAPEWVGFVPGDDPTTSDVVENGYFNPNDIEVDAYVANCASLFDSTANITIDPGDGFTLAAGQNPTYWNLPVGQMEDKVVRWHVVPTGNRSGLVPIHVTATLNPGGTITTTQYVNVPSLPTRTFQPGTHFIGLPFTFTDARPSVVFPDLTSSMDLAWYDPQLPGYRSGKNDEFSLQPGRGYWLKIPDQNSLTMANATPVNQKATYPVQLQHGWNAICNPYQYSIIWGLCRVLYNFQDYSLKDAIRLGLIRQELWSWDETNQQYQPPINPSPSNQLNMEVKANQGYWLYAGNDVSLIYTPNPYIAVMDPNVPQAKAVARKSGQPDEWQVNIITEAAGAVDKLATFGVSTAQQDGLSDGDMMKPPISPTGVSSYFPHNNWGRMSGNFAVDLQAPGTEKTWTFEVNCMKPNVRVTMRWPDMTGAPAHMPIMLTDVATGQQISMRTSPSFSFNSGTGGIRRFTITAGGTVAQLHFTQVQANTGRTRGTTGITFGVTIPADVKIHVRTPTGRLVRTLEPTRADGGISTVYWDGKDAQGHLLSSGIYLCELYAESADGQRVRASLMLKN